MIVQHHWQFCCVGAYIQECVSLFIDCDFVAVPAKLVWFRHLIFENGFKDNVSREKRIQSDCRQSWQPSSQVSYNLGVLDPLVAESERGSGASRLKDVKNIFPRKISFHPVVDRVAWDELDDRIIEDDANRLRCCPIGGGSSKP